MAWYWWILIGLALIGFIFLKVKVGGAWMRKERKKKEAREKRLEEDE